MGLAIVVFALVTGSADEELPESAADPAPTEQAVEPDAASSERSLTALQSARYDAQTVYLGSWYRDEAQATPHALVWPVEGGLAVLDGDGYRVKDPPIAVGVQEAAGLELLSGGRRTWGVLPSDPDTVYIVSMNQTIVSTDVEQAIAYQLDNGEKLSVGVSSFGGWSAGTDLPAGTETLSVPGFGMLVLPETGGTLRVRGGGLEPFSDDRIVAGTGATFVAQRCDETLTCGLYVLSIEEVEAGQPGAGRLLADVDVGTVLVPGPRGDVVLSVLDDGVELITVDGGRRLQLGSDLPLAVSWAPDASFVAWLTTDALHMAFPDGRYERVQLPEAVTAPGLLVTSPPN